VSPLSRRRFVHLLGAGAAGSLLVPTVAARGMEARFGPRDPDGATRAKDLIRLDSNENPNGPGRAALAAIAGAGSVVNRYPDDASEALRAALARMHGVEPASVCVSCGSTDVLRATVQAYASPTRAVVTAAPTYESPTWDAERGGAPVRVVPVRADLRLDLDAMAAESRGAGIVYVCNPNNPTATVHGAAAVQDCIARVLRETPDCTILVDEAYHEYVDDPAYRTMLPLALENPRVVVARTFSKVHGMAGLRVGYAVGHADTIKAIARHVLDIGVNVVGATAAMASLGERGHVEREQARNREAREHTMRFFRDAGFAPAPSQANFVMVDIRRDAKAFREACRARGVAIGRLFPPLLTHARVSIGTMDEMREATRVFRQVLSMA
jgi:histidinol-phosphate aminotransferase